MLLALEFIVDGAVALMAGAGYLTALDSLDDLAAFFLLVGAFGISALTDIVVKLGKARREILELKKVEPNKVDKPESRGVCEKRPASLHVHGIQLDVAGGVLSSLDLSADVVCLKLKIGE